MASLLHSNHLFTNLGNKDPCIHKECKNVCPIGFTRQFGYGDISGEFRIDFSGCNLDCPFCWAEYTETLNIEPEEVVEKIKCRCKKFQRSGIKISLNYIRITGGEPIASRKRVENILLIAKMLDEEISKDALELKEVWKPKQKHPNLFARRELKIQTNGVKIEETVDILENLNLNNIGIRVEVSFKGTNEKEFEILSRSKCFSFKDQLIGFKRILSLEKRKLPIVARAIFGCYHSRQYDLVYPHSDRRMFLYSYWDKEFREILKEVNHKKFGGEKIAIEPICFTERMRRQEEICKKLGILSSPQIGRELDLKPGRKKYIKKGQIGAQPIGFSKNSFRY